ncbi:MAG: UDP-N-acetylmuramoyl-L-alanine--D-glutamate ligase, partial [Bacilli bacterium]|nr:UDP-N-acetylmuramoyl-L-alanine--D-glutamate ligase [Bacilli bacterium]
HRIEFVKELEGRKFYNDSKATNIKATQIALSSFKTPVILLLGGMERGQDFNELKEFMSSVRLIVTYGECKKRIEEFANNMMIDVKVVDFLENAVNVAYELSNEGDTILLSPAAASWDQYKCFEDRGNEFKKVVNSL